MSRPDQELQPINQTNNNDNNAPDADNITIVIDNTRAGGRNRRNSKTVVSIIDDGEGSPKNKALLTQREEILRLNNEEGAFFHVDAWSLRVGCLGCPLAIMAAVVPQWIYIVPNSLTFGMRATCKGDRCGAIDFNLLKDTLNCDGSCTDAFDQFRLRWRAIEGFGWMAAVLFLLIAGALRIGYTRDVRPDALGAPHVIISIAAIVAVGMSIVIFGGSLNCGTGCFEYGASLICSFIAVGCAAVCIPLGLISAKVEGWRQTAGRGGFAVAILGAAFQAAALLTSKWFYALKTKNSDLIATSVGLWMTCQDIACTGIDLEAQLKPGRALGCSVTDAATLGSRLTAGGAMLIVGGVLCLALAIVAYTKFGQAYHLRPILLFFSLVFVTIGNSVVLATLDNWMFCERTYCEVISRTGTDTACSPGTSFAFGICVNIALGIVGLFELVNVFFRMCEVQETEGQGLLRKQQHIVAERRERLKIQKEMAVAEREREREAIAEVQKRKLEDEAQIRKAAAAAELKRLVAEKEESEGNPPREEEEKQQKQATVVNESCADAEPAATQARAQSSSEPQEGVEEEVASRNDCENECEPSDADALAVASAAIAAASSSHDDARREDEEADEVEADEVEADEGEEEEEQQRGASSSIGASHVPADAAAAPAPAQVEANEEVSPASAALAAVVAAASHEDEDE